MRRADSDGGGMVGQRRQWAAGARVGAAMGGLKINLLYSAKRRHFDGVKKKKKIKMVEPSGSLVRLLVHPV